MLRCQSASCVSLSNPGATTASCHLKQFSIGSQHLFPTSLYKTTEMAISDINIIVKGTPLEGEGPIGSQNGPNRRYSTSSVRNHQQHCSYTVTTIPLLPPPSPPPPIPIMVPDKETTYTDPDLPHFLSIPWCATILSNPTYKSTPTPARIPKTSTEDSLIATTLQSPDTITHYLTLFTPPPPQDPFIPEIISLLTLGSGLNGGAHVLHGGIITTIIDDTMGMLLVLNGAGGSVTAELKMRFLKRVSTPATVVAGARCVKREDRRKFWMEGWLKDGEGTVLAKGDGVWINIGAKRDATGKL